MTDYLEHYARSVPKVDLHCHLTGSIPLDKIIELAELRDRDIDIAHLRDVYDLTADTQAERSNRFFTALDVVASLLLTPEDLAFSVVAIAGSAATNSNLQYLEMFVNPTALMRTGMTFTQVRDGLLAGAHASLVDHGVEVRFIACFLREEPTSFAESMLDNLIEHRTDHFIGVGLDGPETLPMHQPGRFAGLYDRAGRAGFRRTAHLNGPATDVVVLLDELHCDRIDHAYPVMDDPAMVERLTKSGVPITCCLTITSCAAPDDSPYAHAHTHPASRMIKAGLPVSLGTDDGGVVPTTIGDEYALATRWYDWAPDEIDAMSLAGVDAAWLDDVDASSWRSRFRQEQAGIRQTLWGASATGSA